MRFVPTPNFRLFFASENPRQGASKRESRLFRDLKEETMGQVMTLCTSDEADEHGYDKTTVEKASALLFL